MALRPIPPHTPRFELLESPTTFELFAELPGGEPEAVDVAFDEGVLELAVHVNEPTLRTAGPPTATWSARVEFTDVVDWEAGLRAVAEPGMLHVSLVKRFPREGLGDDERVDPEDLPTDDGPDVDGFEPPRD